MDRLSHFWQLSPTLNGSEGTLPSHHSALQVEKPFPHPSMPRLSIDMADVAVDEESPMSPTTDDDGAEGRTERATRRAWSPSTRQPPPAQRIPQNKSSMSRPTESTSPVSPSSIYTAPTVDTEASRTTSGNNKATVVKMEHSVKKKNNQKLKKLAKPLLALVILLIMGSTAFFFTKWLEIPGLNEQIDRLSEQVTELETQVDALETQVDRLGAEIDELEAQNDRLEGLNDELVANNNEFERQNKQLNETLKDYQEVVQQLNATVEELDRQNKELGEQLETYEELNNDLNSTVRGLTDQVDRLENITSGLMESNEILSDIVDELVNETASLSSINQELNETTQRLLIQTETLQGELTRLQALNDNLERIVSFLDETAQDLDQTYGQLAAFLSEQIAAYRVLVLEMLQNTYFQRIMTWDCDMQSYFLTEPFVKNRTMVIASESYPAVLGYVEERVLSELCLDTSDFENHLLRLSSSGANGVSDVTLTSVLQAVATYTSRAMDFYFPDPGDNPAGLTSDDWLQASYQCEKLPGDRLFSLYRRS